MNYFADVGKPSADAEGTPKASGPIIPAGDFMSQYEAPDYVVDGIIQRSRLYSLTSPTGHGKTAVALFIAFMVAEGRSHPAIEVTQGAVVLLAGENPDDVRARFWACADHYNINIATLPLYVLPGNFPMDQRTAERLRIQIDGLEKDVALVIADTAAAFFPGDDENGNVQMGAYARTLRTFLSCRGRPAVLVPAHPMKHADKDCLLPRGGGAFLSEVDGNLTLWSDTQGENALLHWQGKIRGPDFNPVPFYLASHTVAGIHDSKGRPIPSIVANIQTPDEADRMRDRALSDENVVLGHLLRSPGISFRRIASAEGWVNAKGEPNASKVNSAIQSLKEDKYVKLERKKYYITEAGKKELDKYPVRR